MPLFLFHLLEYLDVDYEIDVDEINARWSRLAADDEWSQLIIKETEDRVELLTRAPRTGIWHLDENGHFVSPVGWTTGTPSSTSQRRSICASPHPATIATRVRTWECSVTAGGCRPPIIG